MKIRSLEQHAPRRYVVIIIILTILIGFTTPLCTATTTFDDVPPDNVFYENVVAANELGLMIGQTTTHFGVKSNLSRQAALIIACRVHCLYHAGTTAYAQIEGTLLEQSLAYARDHGIYTALPNWTSSVTRGEMAMLLSSALPNEALTAINEVPDNCLPDVSTSDEYGAAIYRLYRAGILVGSDSRGAYNPDSYITRGAASAIATRMIDESLRRNLYLSNSAYETISTGNGTLTTRIWRLDNGDTVTMGSLANASSVGSVVLDRPATGGILHFNNGNGWENTPLAEGDYICTYFIYEDASGSSMMAFTPQSWLLLENNSRQHLPEQNGYLRVTQTDSGYRLSLIAGATPPGSCADFTFVESDNLLLDWSKPGFVSLWNNYNNAGDGRWCFDGYYWPSPTTYIPSGSDVYYAMTDAYLCRSYLAQAPYARLAYDLAYATMDVMAERQNSRGFFPTQSESTWLSGDYNIGAGFYDTRFNTDLIEMFLDAESLYKTARFTQVIDRYVTFFTEYAASHHTKTINGGWYVWDYFNPTSGNETHSSLNHQLAEILTLYHLADRAGDESLRELGDLMLLAIEDTETSWVRDDSNLHYAVYPSGDFGGTDYPYLTYNDLYFLQQYFTQNNLARNEALDRLMDSKREWMDAHNITGYKGS